MAMAIDMGNSTEDGTAEPGSKRSTTTTLLSPPLLLSVEMVPSRSETMVDEGKKMARGKLKGKKEEGEQTGKGRGKLRWILRP